jgi:hypothetical protein
MSTTSGTPITVPFASTFTRTPINALSVPQPSGAHPPMVKRVPITTKPIEPGDLERDVVFRVKPSDIFFLGADFELLISVLLYDFDAPRKRRIALFATVLLYSEPSYACDKDYGGCYPNPDCERFHSTSILFAYIFEQLFDANPSTPG